MSNERPTCKTCPYWDMVKGDESIGSCRRFPPRIVEHLLQRDAHGEPDENNQFLATFMPVAMEDWFCGEHPDFQAWIASRGKEQS